MKAVVLTRAGGADALELREVPELQPGPTEVLIDVRAVGVNRHDVNLRQRGPSVPNEIPGLEVSGVVRAVGSAVTNVTPGDAVCALTEGGAYAQAVVTDAGLVLPKPAALDWFSAAALAESLFTAYLNLVTLAQLKRGDSVLIHGGTGGVGHIALQLAVALGIDAYATAGSAEKRSLCISLGASGAWDYAADYPDQVREATRGQGVTAVMDTSGGRHLDYDIASLAVGGRVLIVSSGANAAPPLPLRQLMARRAMVTGALLKPLPIAQKREIGSALRRLSLDGIKPIVASIYPLSDAGAAQMVLEKGLAAGKIVLAV